VKSSTMRADLDSVQMLPKRGVQCVRGMEQWQLIIVLVGDGIDRINAIRSGDRAWSPHFKGSRKWSWEVGWRGVAASDLNQGRCDMSAGNREDRPRFLESFSSSLQGQSCNWGAEANLLITNAVGAPPAFMDLVTCFLASVALPLLGSMVPSCFAFQYCHRHLFRSSS